MFRRYGNSYIQVKLGHCDEEQNYVHLHEHVQHLYVTTYRYMLEGTGTVIYKSKLGHCDEERNFDCKSQMILKTLPLSFELSVEDDFSSWSEKRDDLLV